MVERIKVEEKPVSKCHDGLIELRNSLKSKIREEYEGSIRYMDAAAKLTHYGRDVQAKAVQDMARDEMFHYYALQFVVDLITKECGE
ncbi:hypothetical protein LCGC14_0655070 [marine sediment metagenome]|uniref:Uncharacterized protein n=1 Tax=marine sediment metagenome TaxID=412755 RepID=A0A0F9QVC2_9ZZZZ